MAVVVPQADLYLLTAEQTNNITLKVKIGEGQKGVSRVTLGGKLIANNKQGNFTLKLSEAFKKKLVINTTIFDVNPDDDKFKTSETVELTGGISNFSETHRFDVKTQDDVCDYIITVFIREP